jgi:hypothetical protein
MRQRLRPVRGSLGLFQGAMSSKAPGAALPAYEADPDAEGFLGGVRPRQTLTLIERLMVRAGSMPAPAAPPEPVRRGRGRPRKGVAPALLQQPGADGQPVKPVGADHGQIMGGESEALK